MRRALWRAPHAGARGVGAGEVLPTGTLKKLTSSLAAAELQSLAKSEGAGAAAEFGALQRWASRRAPHAVARDVGEGEALPTDTLKASIPSLAAERW